MRHDPQSMAANLCYDHRGSAERQTHRVALAHQDEHRRRDGRQLLLAHVRVVQIEQPVEDKLRLVWGEAVQSSDPKIRGRLVGVISHELLRQRAAPELRDRRDGWDGQRAAVTFQAPTRP